MAGVEGGGGVGWDGGRGKRFDLVARGKGGIGGWRGGGERSGCGSGGGWGGCGDLVGGLDFANDR